MVVYSITNVFRESMAVSMGNIRVSKQACYAKVFA